MRKLIRVRYLNPRKKRKVNTKWNQGEFSPPATDIYSIEFERYRRNKK
jgi:hypothetical protein